MVVVGAALALCLNASALAPSVASWTTYGNGPPAQVMLPALHPPP
jgi:hypothetical protein